jgi:hypothetical protein
MHHHPRRLFEHAVAVAVIQRDAIAFLGGHLGQQQRIRIAALLADEFGDGLHFRRVHEGALHADQVVAGAQQHVAPADQLVRAAGCPIWCGCRPCW